MQRTNPKLKIKNTDRLVFSIIKDLLSTWKEKLFIVKPETVIKWHRTAFRTYWRIKSKHKEGRPVIEEEVVVLIKQIAIENLLWGVPRIHGEMKLIQIKFKFILFKYRTPLGINKDSLQISNILSSSQVICSINFGT